MYFLGIDIGSLSCDAVVINGSKQIIASCVIPTGVNNLEAALSAKKHVMDAAGIRENDLKAVITTGYGRNRINDKDGAATEIVCHAKGIRHVLPDTRVLIDIGGQDSKALYLSETGDIIDFAMNDKCAAGTGRFLEAMARVLQVDIQTLSELDKGVETDLVLTSMCTVFAESEVVALIARGTDPKKIAKGLNRSVATRAFALVKRVVENFGSLTVSMSGGVARNKGVVRAIAETMGLETIHTPEKPDTIGALGAALIGFEKAAKDN